MLIYLKLELVASKKWALLIMQNQLTFQVHQMTYMRVLVRVNTTQAMQHVETHGR